MKPEWAEPARQSLRIMLSPEAAVGVRCKIGIPEVISVSIDGQGISQCLLRVTTSSTAILIAVPEFEVAGLRATHPRTITLELCGQVPASKVWVQIDAYAGDVIHTAGFFADSIDPADCRPID